MSDAIASENNLSDVDLLGSVKGVDVIAESCYSALPLNHDTFAERPFEWGKR